MNGRRGSEFDTDVLRWLCDVADAITAVGPLKVAYGEYDLADIRVTFDGDPKTGLAVVGSEHGNRFVVATWEDEASA
jgi:hypothetical protein